MKIYPERQEITLVEEIFKLHSYSYTYWLPYEYLHPEKQLVKYKTPLGTREASKVI